MDELKEVFVQLRNIMKPLAVKLDVKKDSDTYFYVDTFHIMKNKSPLFFGAVAIKKNYVSYYLMALYLEPGLAKNISHELNKHKQGKSCFNFKTSDKKLFKELEKLTKSCYKYFKEQKFIK